MPYIKSIRDVLKVDPVIIDGLAKFAFTDGALEPAIFSYDPAPDSAGNPVITIVTGIPSAQGVKGKRSGLIPYVVSLWGDMRNENPEPLRALGRRVWELLDKQNYNPTATKAAFTLATTPPQFIRDRDGFPGYIINIQLKISETD